MLAGCAASAPVRPAPVPPSISSDFSGGERGTPGALERRFTGQQQPSITVRNAFATTQQLFIDWLHVGSVAPSASATFDVTVGIHTLTSAESMDVDDKPVSVTETFETGFRYGYQIVPE
jgi:hypothetical protein